MFIGDYRQAFDYLENEIVKTGKRAVVVTNRLPTGWFMMRLGEWCAGGASLNTLCLLCGG